MNELKKPKKLSKKILADYEKILKNYKYVYLAYVKEHLYYLQNADIDDLWGEIGVKHSKLIYKEVHKKTMKLDEDNSFNSLQKYCRVAYARVIQKYMNKRRKVKEMNREMTYLGELDNFVRIESGSESDRVEYWEHPLLQGMTILEQDVILCRAKELHYKEIKRLIKYDGPEEGLRQVMNRAQQKAISNGAQKPTRW